MGKLTGLWLLLAALNVALTADTVVYFADGGQLTIELRPPFPDRITNLLWTFQGNMMAEWNEKLIPLTYYRPFQNRSTLSTTTGQLVINNMTKNDQGQYLVTINSKRQSETYMAKLIKTVPKPLAEMKPWKCSGHSQSCDATCVADIVGAEPVTYSWKKGDGEWKESKRVIDLTKIQDAGVETLTCQIQNPVSKEVSDPVKNLLYKPPKPVGPIVGSVVVVLLVIGAVLGGLFVARKKKMGPFKDRSTNSTDPAPGNGQPNSHPNDASAKPAERVALTDKDAEVEEP